MALQNSLKNLGNIKLAAKLIIRLIYEIKDYREFANKYEKTAGTIKTVTRTYYEVIQTRQNRLTLRNTVHKKHQNKSSRTQL